MVFTLALVCIICLVGRAHSSASATSRQVHAFFYLWYGNPATDGQWQHWNHATLPHWNPSVAQRFPEARYNPDEGDVHSRYFPQRGLYSSSDPDILRMQFREMIQHGIGVAVVSWWGRPGVDGTHDTQGVSTDRRIPLVLDVAAEVGLEIAFHLEPYADRSVETVASDLRYLAEQYGHHPALHRSTVDALRCRPGTENAKPIVYVYDSYHIAPDQWRRLLTTDGDLSIRGTFADVVAIGLWLRQQDGQALLAGGFDGSYSYFASEGSSFGSTVTQWPPMQASADALQKVFIPSVAPGYDDRKIRPWNAGATKDRRRGEYYDWMWQAALDAGACTVSITSYNEWGEGTQIEPAVPHRVPEGAGLSDSIREQLFAPREYANYSPLDPDGYLRKTLTWSQRLAETGAPSRQREEL